MDIAERRRIEKEEATQKRKEQILNAGKNLFSWMSPGSVTIAAIARECALSPPTIYLYYQSKEDLLFHIVNDFLLNGFLLLNAPMDGTGLQRVGRVIEELKQDYLKNLQAKNLMAHFNLYYEKEYPNLPSVEEFERNAQKTNDLLEEIILSGQRDGSIRSDINPRLYGCLLGNLAGYFGTSALRRALLIKNQKMDPYEEFCLALDLVYRDLKA